MREHDRSMVVRQLMTDHGDAVFGICVRILRDRVLAEDVQQQVFLEAHRDLARFEGRSTLRAWLFGITTHRCQDAIKMRRRRERRFHNDDQAVRKLVDPAADPHVELDRSRVTRALDDCLAELSVENRTAILLRFQLGMSYEEMASALRTRPDTLHARVSRGLRLLRRLLETRGWDR